MLEAAKPLFGGGGGQLAVLENRGGAVMSHAVEGKQIKRKILNVFAKRWSVAPKIVGWRTEWRRRDLSLASMSRSIHAFGDPHSPKRAFYCLLFGQLRCPPLRAAC